MYKMRYKRVKFIQEKAKIFVQKRISGENDQIWITKLAGKIYPGPRWKFSKFCRCHECDKKANHELIILSANSLLLGVLAFILFISVSFCVYMSEPVIWFRLVITWALKRNKRPIFLLIVDPIIMKFRFPYWEKDI